MIGTKLDPTNPNWRHGWGTGVGYGAEEQPGQEHAFLSDYNDAHNVHIKCLSAALEQSGKGYWPTVARGRNWG